MVYGIGNNCLKLLMFVANFLIFVIGAVIFGLSLWITLDKNFAETLRKLADSFKQMKIPDEIVTELSKYQAALWVFVAVGALLMVVGFLGCCGAGCQSTLLLTLFFVVVLVLAIIQLFALVYMYSNRDVLEQAIHKAFNEYGYMKDEKAHEQFLPLQDAFKCCGPTEETKATFVAEGICTEPEYPDCYTVLKEYLEKNAKQIMIAGILLLIVQAFAMLFSCVLCRAFRRDSGPYYIYS